LGKVSVQELGQLFHDFNFLAEPISRGHAIDLDQSNIYIQLTNALARTPVIRDNGGVEPRAASLGGKSTALVTKQVLLRFVRGACDGPAAQERLRDNVSGNLSRHNLVPELKRIEEFLGVIAETMGSSFKDHELLHLTAPGWNAMGVICHDLGVVLRDKISPDRETDILKHIGHIDWSRWNQDFIGYIGDAAVEMNGEEVKRGRGRPKTVDPSLLREVIDQRGRRKLGFLYGGRLGLNRFIAYIRSQSGLFDALRLHAPDALAGTSETGPDHLSIENVAAPGFASHGIAPAPQLRDQP